jgi:hypothetical protein
MRSFGLIILSIGLFILTTTIEGLRGEHYNHLKEQERELNEAGIQYKILSYNQVFDLLTRSGCKPMFRYNEEWGSIEVFYRMLKG